MSIYTLDATSWDVLIAGTGLHESLLALALSRSGKTILHVDKDDYYGGANAALSLQDAEDWAGKHSGDHSTSSLAKATIHKPTSDSSATPGASSLQLSFSRAYSLALSPQIIYAQTSLLPALVSSGVDKQLEFLAVGSCFVFTGDPEAGIKRSLIRVPSSREDVFADEALEPKHKRGLMKFLRFIGDFEDQREIWDARQSQPFDEFLLSMFNMPPVVQRPLQALTLSPFLPGKTKTSFALPRIARHLRSIGVFGPGFGSVIPKWGGLSEIAQAGCRSCAVGGGVYVLGNGLEKLQASPEPEETAPQADARRIKANLKRGEIVTADWIVMANNNTPMQQSSALTLGASRLGGEGSPFPETVYRSIYIVSSPLKQLFPQLVDGAPTPAAAVIVVPNSSLSSGHNEAGTAPVYIMVHSSDTGECPVGQSVLYASVTAHAASDYTLLDRTVASFLESIDEEPIPQVLWELQYEQHSHNASTSNNALNPEIKDGTIIFPPPSQDLAYDDKVLRDVRDAWQKIVGPDYDGDFMMFAAREEIGAEETDD